MGKELSGPLNEVTFQCKPCRHTFKAAPDRVVDAPEDDSHQFAYFHACPKCGEEAGQAWFERNLMKAWTNSTGPNTPEGKAAVTENLKGHPTQEEVRLTRFNAMKHGLTARTASYFPPKPDKYAFCKACDVDREFCSQQPACVQQTRHFMLHHAAFDQKKPSMLMGIYADFHAALMLTIQQMLQQIVADGVVIKQPKVSLDKDGISIVLTYDVRDASGNVVGTRQVIDIEAHPLFRPLGELISRTGISLADLGMTPKAVELNEQAMGNLAPGNNSQETIEQFALTTAKSLEALTGMVSRAQENAGKDPVLLEFQRQQGG